MDVGAGGDAGEDAEEWRRGSREVAKGIQGAMNQVKWRGKGRTIGWKFSGDEGQILSVPEAGSGKEMAFHSAWGGRWNNGGEGRRISLER